MAGLQEKMSVNSETGVVHIPPTHRAQPGHPKGGFIYKENKITERPGMHMLMNPGKENIWIQFTLGNSILKKSKKYQLSMRFQTDKPQNEPLTLAVKRGDINRPPEYTMEIPLPNTKNLWQTLDPLELGVELGGPTETYLVFSHPKPVGKGILIRDFSLIPSGQARQAGEEYSAEWLAKWRHQLAEKVQKNVIPKLEDDLKQTFLEKCKVAHKAYRKGQTNVGATIKIAEEELKVAVKECHETALPMFEGSIDSALDSIDIKSEEGQQLLQAIVLAHGKPSELGDYAAQGEEQKKRLQDFLQDFVLMYRMLVHGGPKGGDYGRALDIHAEIEAKRQQGKSVLPKLSLAVALELAEPLQAFQQKEAFIDPIDRYMHYEEAYLNRELDPAFESLTIWELRMAVNSDAPNEQLSWCREMIKNYHPHIAVMDEYHWRYAWIVRTDVYYQEPEWKRLPHDYMQVLSGGGMCGPRAWMGRFACQAFGNPTWGVRQPGHAAMTRWTPNGWLTALGGGFRVSSWEERDGLDFECETKIRASLGDEGYFRKVALLEWIGHVVGDFQQMSYIKSYKTWPSLAILQRQRLSKDDTGCKAKEIGQCEVLSRIADFRAQPKQKESITMGENGSIVVPMSCRTSASGPKIFQKSFLGGMQVFVKPGWNLTFTLPCDTLPGKRVYRMSVRFVTVHETDAPPLLVTAKDATGSNTREYEIPLPGHWQDLGMWQTTKPIEVELGGVEEAITLTRKQPKYPCTLKDFTLTPC